MRQPLFRQSEDTAQSGSILFTIKNQTAFVGEGKWRIGLHPVRRILFNFFLGRGTPLLSYGIFVLFWGHFDNLTETLGKVLWCIKAQHFGNFCNRRCIFPDKIFGLVDF